MVALSDPPLPKYAYQLSYAFPELGGYWVHSYNNYHMIQVVDRGAHHLTRQQNYM